MWLAYSSQPSAHYLLRIQYKGGAGKIRPLNFTANATAMTSEENLFAGFNNRGKRQYRKLIGTVEKLSEEFSEYENVGLPAHKAALDGNIEALTQIFLWLEDEVPALDVNGATPLHLAAKQNRVNAIK